MICSRTSTIVELPLLTQMVVSFKWSMLLSILTRMDQLLESLLRTVLSSVLRKRRPASSSFQPESQASFTKLMIMSSAQSQVLLLMLTTSLIMPEFTHKDISIPITRTFMSRSLSSSSVTRSMCILNSDHQDLSVLDSCMLATIK